MGQALTLVPDCSGNGNVDPATGLCVCNEGWSSIGDFSPVPGLDCPVNLKAIKALAWISLVLGVGSQAVFMHYLATERGWLKKLEIKHRFAITYLLQTVTCNIYDIGVLASRDTAIYGDSIYATVVCTIAYATAYGGCIVFFEAVLMLLQQWTRVLSIESQQKYKTSLSLFTSRTPFLYFFCASSSLVGFAAMFVDRAFCHILARWMYGCWIAYHVIFAIAFNPPASVIRSELVRFVSDMRSLQDVPSAINVRQFEDVQRNLLIAQVAVNGLFIVTTGVYLSVIVSNAVARVCNYVTLYCTIGVHVLSFPMLFALTYKAADKPGEPGRTARYKPQPFSKAPKSVTDYLMKESGMSRVVAAASEDAIEEGDEGTEKEAGATESALTTATAEEGTSQSFRRPAPAPIVE